MQSADKTVLSNESIIEIHILSRKSSAKLKNDTATFFDRVIWNLTTLYYHHFKILDIFCKIQATN